MKKILLILFLTLTTTILPSNSFAQDKIDRLADQIAELAKQQSKLSDKVDKLADKVDKLVEQQAITATKVDGLEKSVKERLDMQSNFMIAILGFVGVLFLAILGFIGFILWDRKTTNAPLETTTAELKKEIDLLKERETKLEDFSKKVLLKFPDLANLT